MAQWLWRSTGIAGLTLLAFLGAGCSGEPAAPSCPDWAQWQDFRNAFLSEDGRVIDRGSPDSRTVSEGQAYALLFALAANDRAAFDRILAWTEANLADGDLTARLPAWLWGRNDQDEWGVIDANAASDADTWMAYALIEAGRLWQTPRYAALGRLLADRVRREAVADLPGLGPTLLPAPAGFQTGPDRWRLNPSYLPVPLLRRLAAVNSDWTPVIASARAVITRSAVGDFAPDWTAYGAETGFGPDPEHGTHGDYDAIRVYLWAGMMDRADPLRNDLLEALPGMARAVAANGQPPERVADGDVVRAVGPPGFSAALLPYLSALGRDELVEQQRLRLEAQPIPDDSYYQRVLSLFGQGWQDRWLRFDRDGRLQVRWEPACGA